MSDVARVIEIAKAVDAGERTSELFARANALEKDDSLPRVGFLGVQGAGKTTLINLLLGTEVREPQLFPDSGKKPLRVTFDRRNGDEHYDCASVANHVWSESVDCLYEFDLSEQFLKEEGTWPVARGDIDYWFFTINASMPLSGTEVEALKKVPPESVTVLITRTDLLRRAEDIERVREIVAAFCAQRNLGNPIVCGVEDGQTLGKILRRQLPDAERLTELRQKRNTALTEVAREFVRGEIRRAISENEAACHAAQESHAAEDLAWQRKLTIWGAVKADVLESGNTLAGEIERLLFTHLEELTDALYMDGEQHSFSNRWSEDGLPKKVEECLKGILETQEETVTRKINQDLSALLQKAEELQIVLQHFNMPVGGQAGVRGLKKDQRGENSALGAAKLATMSVAAVGGLVLLKSTLDVSGAFTVAATAAAAGAIHQQYRSYKQTRESSWRDVLRQYAEDNLRKLSRIVREEILSHYNHAADMISESAALQKAEFDERPFQKRKETLEKFLEEI